MSRFSRNRDHYAGLLTALIGAGAIWEGWGYGIGTLASMGSGFFPAMLGMGMVLMGVLMATTRPAPDTHAPAQPNAHALRAPDWRGAASIMAAVALFILLADRAGLAPATFACVFVGALGTSTTKLIEAAILAAAVTIFGVVLFRYGLQIQFPIIRGVMQ
ncbi:MAG: tripartite tricarboxylate transporter TctB family protein [Janthinobacterium lividum]